MDDNRDSLIVSAIDSKPHKVYIRYLLVQRYSPSKIKKDLSALGLSAPHEDALERYYYLVIEPMVKLHKLGFLYAPYKDAMTKGSTGREKKSNRFSMVLNYRTDIASDLETEIRFLRFITDLNIMDAFGPDLIRYYGKLENVPNDPETGKSFTESLTRYKEMPWDIVESPYRHLIEELLLEGTSAEYIIAYMDKNYNVRVRTAGLNMYTKIFFGVDRFDQSKQLRVLTAERENLMHEIRRTDNTLAEIDRGSYDGDKTTPELIQERKMLYSRISGLDTTIKSVQSRNSEVGIGQARAEKATYTDMFEDMMETTYKKFQMFAKHNDRSIVEPLYKLTKMASNTYDMIVKSKEDNLKGGGHTQAELIRMVNEREAEVLDEQLHTLDALNGFDTGNFLRSAPIDMAIIEGVEELLKKEEDEDEDEQI